MPKAESVPGDENLEQLGLRRWQRRGANSAGQGEDVTLGEAPEAVESDAEKSTRTLTLDAQGQQRRVWSTARKAVEECTLCELHKTRRNTVFGVGSEEADLMLIGEAPGADEDAQGEPFVGRAGRLLDSMLTAIGLNREQVFIANILKCRPPGNENPTPEQAQKCREHLDRQLELIKPRIILALGAVAAHNLLGVETPIGKLRGVVHELPGSDIRVVATYHPAYLLRRPQGKAQAFEDLLLLCDAMGRADAPKAAA